MSGVNEPAQLPPVTLYDDDGWPGGTVTIKDAAGVPVDLTDGWSGWRCQWRPATGSDEHIDLDVDVSGAATGVIAWSLMDKARMGLMHSDGGYDLEAVDGAGVPRTWVRGETRWLQGYTR